MLSLACSRDFFAEKRLRGYIRKFFVIVHRGAIMNDQSLKLRSQQAKHVRNSGVLRKRICVCATQICVMCVAFCIKSVISYIKQNIPCMCC